MIEAGLVALINTGLNNSAIKGFPVQLPKDWITATNTKAWVYRSVASSPLYTLQSEDALTAWYVAIDCNGYAASDAQSLSTSIESILRGYVAGGSLTDTDHTQVQFIKRLPRFIDGFDSDNRTFVRSIQYVVHYLQS